jgi:hypothetical protein
MRRAGVFPFHHETKSTLHTSAQRAFDFLDDFSKLSAHMERPSAMMLGSRMEIATDEGGGRAVGSRVRLSGQVLGIRLSLEEVVVERQPPTRKAWDTVQARLLVIGQYRLGFELTPRNEHCDLRVFIDYDWPRGAFSRCIAALLAKRYARWCTERMANDAAEHFAMTETPRKAGTPG